MDKNDCLREKVSAKAVGIFILLASVLLAFVGVLIVPIIGLFFAAPLLILGIAFLLAPESKVCRLLMRKTG